MNNYQENSKIGMTASYQSPNSLVQLGESQVNPTFQSDHSNFPPQGPITNEPIGQGDPNNMKRLTSIPNCPSGLEYLASIDELLVYQKLELLELITSFEMENKYSIHNNLGHMVYHAAEKSETCMRNCCGSARSFEMIITNTFQQEVIHLSRPCKCQCCCCFCCLQTMEVCLPSGVIIGTIEQNWNPLKQSFSIKDPSGDKMLRITGPCCPVSCGSDIDFKIFSVNSDLPIGKISKKWSGFLMEAYTNVDSFGISFPKDLDVKMKAVLLGALFLIDMMFFEQRTSNPR